MKQVRSEFKETLFDWDSEPAMERPSCFHSQFNSVAPQRPPAGGGRGARLLLIVVAAIGAGAISTVFLPQLLRFLIG